MQLRQVGSGPPKLKAIVYGHFGVGKTYFAATAALHPEMGPAMIVNIEDGGITASNLSLMETPPCVTTGDVEAAFFNIANPKHEWSQYGTIIVDSGTALQQMSLAEITRANSKGGSTLQISPRDYGHSTIMLVDLLRKFKNLQKHVIVTAALREDFNTDDPIQKRRLGPCHVAPDFTPALARKVNHIYDHVWCMTVDKGKRYLLTQRQGVYEAKTRGFEFAQKLGAVVEEPNLPKIFDLFKQTQSKERPNE